MMEKGIKMYTKANCEMFKYLMKEFGLMWKEHLLYISIPEHHVDLNSAKIDM